MTFEYFCLRLVQVGLHVVWFLTPTYFYSLMYRYQTPADPIDGPSKEWSIACVGFLISYGLLILGYLKGWNV